MSRRGLARFLDARLPLHLFVDDGRGNHTMDPNIFVHVKTRAAPKQRQSSLASGQADLSVSRGRPGPASSAVKHVGVPVSALPRRRAAWRRGRVETVEARHRRVARRSEPMNDPEPPRSLGSRKSVSSIRPPTEANHPPPSIAGLKRQANRFDRTPEAPSNPESGWKDPRCEHD